MSGGPMGLRAARVALRRPTGADAVIGATYGSALIGVLCSPLVARALGPSDRGYAAAITATAGLTVLIGNLGVDSALLNARVTGRLTAPQLNHVAMRFAWIWGPPAAGIFVLICLALSSSDTQLGPGVLVAGALLVPVGFWGNWCFKSALVERRLAAVACHRALIGAGPALAGAGLALTDRLTPATYVAGFLGSNFAGIAVLSAAANQGREASPVRDHLPFGLRATLGSLASSLNQRLDQILLVPLAGTREAGLYVIAVTLSSLPAMAASAIGSVSIGPMVSSEGVDLQVAARYVRAALAAAGILSVMLALLSPGIPIVFGAQFEGSIAPLLLLLPGALIWAGGSAFADTYAAIGRPGTYSLTETLGMALTVLGLLLVAPSWGAAGAGAVSTFAYLITRSIQVVLLRRAGLGPIRPRREDLKYVLARQRDLVGRARSRVGRNVLRSSS